MQPPGDCHAILSEHDCCQDAAVHLQGFPNQVGNICSSRRRADNTSSKKAGEQRGSRHTAGGSVSVDLGCEAEAV